jgi:hypothetical protein
MIATDAEPYRGWPTFQVFDENPKISVTIVRNMD